EKATNKMTSEQLFAPVGGKLVAIDQVKDPVFSQKMMGDGFAVKPTDDHIFSPISGKISNIFETKHAIGILTPAGIEVLVHMGLDTVELKGVPFQIKVEEGQEVNSDTELAIMDRKAIEEADKDTDVLVVFTNMDKVEKIIIDDHNEVEKQKRIGEIEIN
ncbi:MAG TPA: PTS glucose transporter subunit IIA, partial [Tetragenococcus sp.]|nr:PTS glucose transporter subunit IIA [Tetragenococcus sp.]